MRTNHDPKFTDSWSRYPLSRDEELRKEPWYNESGLLNKRNITELGTLKEPNISSRQRLPYASQEKSTTFQEFRPEAKAELRNSGLTLENSLSAQFPADSRDLASASHKQSYLQRPSTMQQGYPQVIDVDSSKNYGIFRQYSDQKPSISNQNSKDALTPGQKLLNSLANASQMMSMFESPSKPPRNNQQYYTPQKKEPIARAEEDQFTKPRLNPTQSQSGHRREPLYQSYQNQGGTQPKSIAAWNESQGIGQTAEPGQLGSKRNESGQTAPTLTKKLGEGSLARHTSDQATVYRTQPTRRGVQHNPASKIREDSDGETDSESCGLSSSSLATDQTSCLTDSEESEQFKRRIPYRQQKGQSLGARHSVSPHDANASALKAHLTAIDANPRNMRFDNSIINKPAYVKETGLRNFHVVPVAQGVAAGSDKGMVRNYMEDRITVFQASNRPGDGARIVKANFFGVYDGHGGTSCSEYLQEQLHKLVLGSEHFPFDPARALTTAFSEAEATFLTKAVSASTPEEFDEDIDVSGSCAVVVLVVDKTCYIANLGDSRVVASYSCGQHVVQLTEDLKPCLDSERNRILSAGGKVYQTVSHVAIDPNSQESVDVFGPTRVFPGRLSVSRSFGDIEAKDPSLGGRRGVVIAVPEICSFDITDDLDFLLMGSDGVFDKLANDEIIQMCWTGIEKGLDKLQVETLDEACYWAIEEVMSSSLARETQDNISTVLVSFKKLSELTERLNIQRLLRRPSAGSDPSSKKHQLAVGSEKR